MSAHVHVCFLWHHHQPYYRDLLTEQFILPWVRLHGIKDYFGMAAILEEIPEAKATINLVPCLIEQLETYISGRGEDRALALSRRNPSTLDADERQFLVHYFFFANPEHMIRPLPRYAELWERAEYGRLPPEKAAARFTDRDLRDLQVLYNLVWFHPLVLEREPELAELRRKGRDFTEEDRAFVLDKQREVLSRILPLHKTLADRGQIEISATPYYHPILPLLCNMESARAAMPEVRLPLMRRDLRVDAGRQIREGIALHERLFGRPPRGMWPSEGSVSDDVVAEAGAAGLRWMATDEAILARSLDRGFPRDEHGLVHHPEALYRPYDREAGGRTMRILFRDAVLSNRIGFDYQRFAPADAIDDFARRVETIRKSLPDGEWTVGVVLDGENAWEHYPGNGVPFLRGLYRRLASMPGVSLSTVSEGCERASAPGRLDRLFPGSWIGHSFHVWVGHEEDRRGWEAVSRVREFVRSASRACGWTEEGVAGLGLSGGYGPGVAEETRRQLDLAWRCIFVAEGSDWYWWFGEDYSSALDGEFDALFRRHLMNAYTALKLKPPADLFRPIKRRIARPGFREPSAMLSITLDGRCTDYFEWISSGRYDAQADMSAMGRSGGSAVREIYFGFEEDRFVLRVDPPEGGRGADLLKGQGLRVVFARPKPRVLRVQLVDGAPMASLADPGGEGPASPAAAAADDVLEVACPFADLGFQGDEVAEFYIETLDNGAAGARFPASTMLRFTVPSADYSKFNWHV
jgi:alpha-amylase/alpha-mannosidase (GH57 family)